MNFAENARLMRDFSLRQGLGQRNVTDLQDALKGRKKAALSVDMAARFG